MDQAEAEVGPLAPGRAGQEAGRDRAVLLTLAAVQFTSIVDFMVVMPLGPQLMRTLGLTPDRFGLIVSSYTLAAGIAGLVASSLIDRFGRKAAFLSLYVGFLIGTLLCGLAPTYATLLTARVITGAFGGVLGGMALAIIGDVFPEERRGAATGALMSAFALASVAGVPFGLYLGTRLGWHAPFLLLAGLGSPVLGLAIRALPPLRGHLGRTPTVHPLTMLRESFTHPNHLRAFALVVSLMFGGFAVIPYISPYLVANVGVAEVNLPFVYMAGGGLTLVAAPVVGRLADRFGKLRVYRIVAPVSAALMLAVTNLPRVSLGIAVAAVAGLMVSNAGRMVAAMAMVTGSVESRRRGGFMSANSSIQHLSTGLGAFVGGKLITQAPDGMLRNFDLVGLIAVASTLLSLWLAGRLRPAGPSPATSAAFCLGAADEAMGDASDPLPAAESA
jgi:predicted MFS family arabinose efflux permease